MSVQHQTLWFKSGETGSHPQLRQFEQQAFANIIGKRSNARRCQGRARQTQTSGHWGLGRVENQMDERQISVFGQIDPRQTDEITGFGFGALAPEQCLNTACRKLYQMFRTNSYVCLGLALAKRSSRDPDRPACRIARGFAGRNLFVPHKDQFGLARRCPKHIARAQRLGRAQPGHGFHRDPPGNSFTGDIFGFQKDRTIGPKPNNAIRRLVPFLISPPGDTWVKLQRHLP